MANLSVKKTAETQASSRLNMGKNLYVCDLKARHLLVCLTAWQNQQNDLCAQRGFSIRSVWSETLLSAWRSTGSLATHWVISLIRLGRCQGCSESSLGQHIILLILSCCGSNKKSLLPDLIISSFMTQFPWHDIQDTYYPTHLTKSYWLAIWDLQQKLLTAL